MAKPEERRMRAAGSISLSRWNVSSPPIPGMIMSRMTAAISLRLSLKISTASRPFPAVRTR